LGNLNLGKCKCAVHSVREKKEKNLRDLVFSRPPLSSHVGVNRGETGGEAWLEENGEGISFLKEKRGE